ncbi:MAG: aspartate--tRNA ligase [Firmicutes bacterium]|nr:aspartate--tRNA ligase [Bacillota bacterium]
MYRTHYANQIDKGLENQEVEIAGWVHRRRDHGGIIFLDLRDRTGLVQVVVEPTQGDLFVEADHLRPEYVISVLGSVRLRPKGMTNPDLYSGEVEVVPLRLDVLAESKVPPFTLQDADSVDELLRLKYRYLDLRRPSLLKNFELRDRVVWSVREFFHQHHFLDVETPQLARSTPEGARDFLVPSRTQPGSFYALPQSPQIFKQLLMVAGFDRYYQIAKVFRDEDLRADRQPEFTQVDVEMAFVSQDDVLQLMETMIRYVFSQTMAVDLDPFPRLTWQQAMDRYGSDKPDLRAGEALIHLTDTVRDSTFPVFSAAETVVGVVVRGPNPSRKQLDEMLRGAKDLGAAGLIWLVQGTDSVRTNVKALGDELLTVLAKTANLAVGDVLFVLAGNRDETLSLAGQLRLLAAQQFSKMDSGWKFLWVTDFPLFEWSDDQGRIVSAHHPFTMPHGEDWERIASDPLSVRSQAYDVVLNGVELASGSVRIHRPDWQRQIFGVLGLSQDEINTKFGFLVDAFQYGAPPHAGIAFGIDRLIMLMAGAKSLREVIAFPKTAKGSDPLMDAPSPVDSTQLHELGLKLDTP